MARPIIFVNRRRDTNIGDRLSSPLNYFRSDYPSAYAVDVHIPSHRLLRKTNGTARRVLRQLRDQAQAIIIGGGGLIGNEYFAEDLAFWSSGLVPTILWGAGHNSHDPLAVSSSGPELIDYVWLVNFASVGLRDWGMGFRWVPCASCMHPAMNGSPTTEYDTVFALHRDLRKEPDQQRRLMSRAPANAKLLFNDETADTFIGTLRKARQVVTNSYHAAFWASLMRKPVVVIGGGTKVRLLKHQVAIGTADNWVEVMKTAPTYSNALEECRDHTSAFHAHVRWLTTDGASPARRGKPRNPIVERELDHRTFAEPLRPAERQRVPRIVHFVFGLSPTFGGKPFNIMHYAAIRSVAEHVKPDEIRFMYQFEPDNEYYRRVKHLINPVPVVAPETYMGQKVEHFAHKADIIRLNALLETGGIYLDLDTVTVASFDPILDYAFTIGLQGRERVEGLCNAVMAAAPNNAFVAAWLDQYSRFSASHWDHFSVRLPYLMWRSGKFPINVEPFDRFHWPLWTPRHLRQMFKDETLFPNAVCHHLWESQSFPTYFRAESFADAARRLQRGRSTYARLVRPYL